MHVFHRELAVRGAAGRAAGERSESQTQHLDSSLHAGGKNSPGVLMTKKMLASHKVQQKNMFQLFCWLSVKNTVKTLISYETRRAKDQLVSTMLCYLVRSWAT